MQITWRLLLHYWTSLTSLQAGLIKIPVVVYMPGVIWFGHMYGIITRTLHVVKKGVFEEIFRVLEILVGNLCRKCLF